MGQAALESAAEEVQQVGFVEALRRMSRKVLRIPSPEQRLRHEEERLFQKCFLELMNDPATRERVDAVLAVDDHDASIDAAGYEAERDLPGSPRFKQSGWWIQMLTRYALGMHHGRDRVVLDACTGLGWGAFLVDAVARRVIAVDRDRAALDASARLWPTSCTERVRGSVLALGLPDESVGVALAMESIEHFTRPDIERYLDELHRVLEPGGMLVGSSAFPHTREEAEALCARNPWHLHVCTRAEMEGLLEERFETARVAGNDLFFWARK